MTTSTLMVRLRGGLDAGWRGDDFPAWLPAMLVKELRQGVQAGAFVWTFVGFQAALFLVFSLLALVEGADSEPFHFFFWLAAVAAIAVLIPLRGLAGIGGERAGNALDLLQITRLSATRIVVGKWVALVAQAALVAVTLLPYLVLRYFFGGVDVLAELMWLGWIVAAAAVVAAAALALSTLPMWLRIGIGLVACGVAFVSFVAIVDGPLIFVFGSFDMAARLGILAVAAAYALALLEFAAARIAPPAENHAARKRLLALALAAAWPVAGWAGTMPAASATFLATAPLLGCYAIGAMAERPSRVRTLFTGYRRAGFLGRLAAAVFTPGWATGLVFLAAMLGTCLGGWLGFVGRFVPADWRPVALAFASLGAAAIVCPAPFVALLPRVRHPLLLYGLVQILCFTAFVFANAFRPWTLPWAEYEAGRTVTLPFPAGAIAALAATAATSDGGVAATPAAAAGAATINVAQQVAPRFTIAGLAVIGIALAAVIRPWLRELAATGRLVRGDVPVSPQPVARMAARRGTAAVRPWIWRGDDFPGWLPAMVVRELRQGVQSGVFAWTFIGIQGAMFALMTWALGTFGGAPEGAYGRDFQAMFWLAIAAALVFVIPLRGLTAVSGERAGNNLDLVRLTRLSATRIVLGKWLAIIGQGLLVAAALAPYLVLRYFFGGVNIVVDLEIFAWLAVGAMAVAAAALALSTLPLWLRIGVVVAAVVVGFVPAVELAEEVFRGRLSFARLGVGGRLGILAGLGVYTVALLEYAAARIAPPAENHAGRKRLLAFGITVAWVVAAAFGTTEAGMGTILVTLPLVLCYGVESLLERPAPIASLYRPFGRWGDAGRLAAAVFTPGWATGVPFVAVVATLCLAGWTVFFGRHEPHSIWVALTVGCLLVAAVFFPLPLLVRVPRAQPRLLFYALVQIVCFLVFVYLAAIKPRGLPSSAWNGWVFTLPFPVGALSAFLAVVNSLKSEVAVPFIAAAAVTTLVVLGLVAGPWRAEMRQVMRLVRGGDRRPPVARAA
jgi:hypothetical protein